VELWGTSWHFGKMGVHHLHFLKGCWKCEIFHSSYCLEILLFSNYYYYLLKMQCTLTYNSSLQHPSVSENLRLSPKCIWISNSPTDFMICILIWKTEHMYILDRFATLVELIHPKRTSCNFKCSLKTPFSNNFNRVQNSKAKTLIRHKTLYLKLCYVERCKRAKTSICCNILIEETLLSHRRDALRNIRESKPSATFENWSPPQHRETLCDIANSFFMFLVSRRYGNNTYADAPTATTHQPRGILWKHHRNPRILPSKQRL
jgi:hypothetical protein